MNREIAGVGIVFIVLGFGLVAYPIVFLGGEQLDLEQEMGFLVAPVGLVVVMLGALAPNPETTTVGGAFGSRESDILREQAIAEMRRRGRTAEPRATRVFNPHEPVACRYCRTIITADLAYCPRCARPRECRSCGRTLGIVLDRVTCPTCARSEGLCNCPSVVRAAAPAVAPKPGARRR